MKYFELTGHPRYKFTPRLVNWYNEFDVRDIRIDRFYKLPERHLLTVESSDKMKFSDAIFFPFLLVSQMVKNVIKMYGDAAYFREIMLLDPRLGKSQLYYLPVFEETSELQFVYKTFDRGNVKIESPENSCNIVTLDRNIFWINGHKKRHTIISLDLAESLLRREASGVDLREVVIYRKEEKNYERR